MGNRRTTAVDDLPNSLFRVLSLWLTARRPRLHPLQDQLRRTTAPCSSNSSNAQHCTCGRSLLKGTCARGERCCCPLRANFTGCHLNTRRGNAVQAKRLTQEEFAMNHPAGRIGKRLMLRVADVMLTGAALPLCPPNTLIMEVRHSPLPGPWPPQPSTTAQGNPCTCARRLSYALADGPCSTCSSF